METIDLVTRQQQIATEKGCESSRLGKREYFLYLIGECKTFLENKEPSRRLIIIPGLRGVGKTTLLLQLYNHITTELKLRNQQIFFFSLDELRSFGVSLSDALLTIERQITNKPLAMVKEKLIIILDEIHYSENWALSLKILYDQGYDVLVIASGSSSLRLKETSDLARRRIMKPIYPFSFREYLQMHGQESGGVPDITGMLTGKVDIAGLRKFHTDKAQLINYIRNHGTLEEYLIRGGFPFRQEEAIECTQDLISKIIHKDIEETIKDVNSLMVEKLVNYLAISRAGETSVDKASQKLGISKPAVLEYLNIMEKAELIFAVKPFSNSSKTIRAATKYYLASSSLRAAILYKLMADIRRSETIGELLETAVFSSMRNALNLARIPHQIYYDLNGCDFIIRFENGNTAAIEVKKGSSSVSQLKASMANSNARIGINVSSANEIRMEGKILQIPKELFLLM